jgi:hypothetical protein
MQANGNEICTPTRGIGEHFPPNNSNTCTSRCPDFQAKGHLLGRQFRGISCDGIPGFFSFLQSPIDHRGSEVLSSLGVSRLTDSRYVGKSGGLETSEVPGDL